MAKAISDEIIIAALMNNGTIKDAAAAVGISERTLYDRMNKGDFIEQYKSAKADLVRKAVYELNKQIGAAVNTVVEIMNDSSVNPAIRLQAAQTVLNNANKFSERLNEDEQRVIDQKEDNMFSLI